MDWIVAGTGRLAAAFDVPTSQLPPAAAALRSFIAVGADC